MAVSAAKLHHNSAASTSRITDLGRKRNYVHLARPRYTATGIAFTADVRVLVA